MRKISNKSLVFVADKLNTPNDEINSKKFIKLLDKNSSHIIPDSLHMSFLQPCKDNLPKGDPELDELCAKNEQKREIQTKTFLKTLERMQEIQIL